MGINKTILAITGIILAVVTLIVFLIMLPTVISNVVAAQATTGIDDGTSSIIGQIPIVYSIGGIAIAGGIAFFSARALLGGGGKYG
jgi:hypothetical protein